MATETKETKKVEIPDPYQNPTAYLIAKGWQLAPGAEARSPKSLWYDPTRPRETQEEEVVIASRKLPNGREQTIKQKRITPAAWPVLRDEAVAIQMSRDGV